MATQIVSFHIPGPPKGKGRPKFARVGIFVRTYTPAETAKYENLVALAYKAKAIGIEPHNGPVQLRMNVVFQPPKSWPKKRLAQMEMRSLPHISRPDLDNVEKAVLDGLNGIAFKDDSQVYHVDKTKCYGREPGVTVALTFIDEEE